MVDLMNSPRSRRPDRADIILDAAEALLRRSEHRSLTIDAVAAEAGLSKGGVLHHYASKDALIGALAARKVERMRAGIAEKIAAQGSAPAAIPLAAVAQARELYTEECGFPDALLLAAAENPEAVAGFRAFLAERLAHMASVEGRPGAGGALVFAIIGLMLGRSLGFHRLEGEELERLFAALEVQARELPEA
ncbi:TetR/AcrR family transcriptional regulator [Methylobacterium symbioticum]|nr:TetR/AcrR family transcriptional regulator [Methylobacterium symbioticum]